MTRDEILNMTGRGMKLWVVTGESESDDNYGPLVFSRKPTDEKLEKIAFVWDGDDEKEGPGNYGSYVYLEVDEVELDPDDSGY
jgi:hypothetical protein